MNYKEFVVENYKGIKKLSLKLVMLPDHKILTLIGLNESGKTTILEAMNDFEYEVLESQRHLLIPKNYAGSFTDKIIIKALLQFSIEDKEKIKAFLKDKIEFKEIDILDEVELLRFYEFENSRATQTKIIYPDFVMIRKKIKSKFANLGEALLSELWVFIRESMFPEIIFYKDFLSKFPEKIYLDARQDNIKEKEYLSIIEDVLVSINPKYNVKNSLLDRLKSPSDANRQALEAVENELGAKISKVVFDVWTSIQDVSKKEIVVKTGSEGERFYVRLNIKDGVHSYALSERSLGFRWFFTFLLFTEFRKERIKTSGEILFLLDEPASNLHQAGQQSLLGTFEKVASKARLVYTTHSHHLINPKWLDSAYIIKNKGLQYKEKEDENFNLTKTEIDAYKCKQFIASFPTQTSYFQPILDALDYKPGMLEHTPNIVITEGKFDYFTFKYFAEVVLKENITEWRFYPGHGASKLDLPVALYEAWGRRYIVILDSDPEGKKQKARYINELCERDKIFTLNDIDLSFDSMTTEMLFSEDEKLFICREVNESLNEYEKSSFNTGIQILYSEKRVPAYITEATRARFEKIFNFINVRLSQQLEDLIDQVAS